MRCKAVEPRLSEYIDNRLSARGTLEVERHISDCHSCTRALNELRRTVALLNESPERAVSADFMANLQSRLNGLEPAPTPRAWMQNIASLFRPRVLPVWGAAAAMAGLAIVMMIPRTPEISTDVIGIRPADVTAAQTASHQNLAISVSDPFADIGASNLAAHATTESGESGGDSEVVF